MMRLRLLALLGALVLSACGADPTFAPQPEVDAARFTSSEPPSITLVTVINDRTGSGAHSGLIINGSERVLFDPAGTFTHPAVPVQHDVHYGITDQVLNFYYDYHTRDSEQEQFYLIEHKIMVPASVAEDLLRRAKAYGSVPKAQCAQSIGTLLRGTPGFESLPTTWFPKKLGEAFAALPGVTSRKVTDDMVPNTHGVTMVDRWGNVDN